MGSGAVDRGGEIDRIEVPDVERVLCDAWDHGGTILDAPELDAQGRLVARYADVRGQVIIVVQAFTSPRPRLVQ